MAEPTSDFSAEKRTAERLARAIDFGPSMATGDTVASQSVTATDVQGTDVSSSLIASPGHSGTQVNWTWQAWGSVGASYYTRVVATTTNGEVIARVVRLTIRAA